MPFSRLNYRHLYYFWVVAKEGHLTRAAEQLHVSQSALSAQIRQLEEQLENTLFERAARKLTLTEVGHVVLGYADNIFMLGSELTAALSAGEGQKLQRFRVGGVANLSRNFQENFLRPAMKMENVQLVLESAGFDELLDRLAVHKLDLVLSNRPAPASGEHVWRCRRISRQPVCLVGPPRTSKQAFRFPHDLQEAKMVLPGFDSDIRTEFDMLCASLDFKPRIFAEVDDMAMLRLLARDSGAVALLPEVVVQDELKNGLLEKYCALPKVYENFYAITTERQYQPHIMKLLLAKK